MMGVEQNTFIVSVCFIYPVRESFADPRRVATPALILKKALIFLRRRSFGRFPPCLR